MLVLKLIKAESDRVGFAAYVGGHSRPGRRTDLLPLQDGEYTYASTRPSTSAAFRFTQPLPVQR